MHTLYKKYIAFFIAILLVQVAFAQFTIPEKPKVQTSVYDYAKILSSSEEAALKQKLLKYSDSTSTQIVVATVETINGEYIGTLTPKWAHDWGIGQAKEDNGVFILLANKEREIWISPGYGVEHKLTAGIVGTITRNVIIPEFRNGDYYAGLDKGTDAIFKVLNGTYKNNQPAQSQNDSEGIPVFVIIFIIFIILMIVFSKKDKGGGGNNRRYRDGSTAASILEAIILSRAGRGGFGGGGFGGGSSGGFGSGGFGGGFGGGGFSGGGAGGSW